MKNNDILEYNGLKIEPVIFTQGFVPGCDINICSGQCCNWGVYMDVNFRDVIMMHKDDIISIMDDLQIKDTAKWFENETEDDDDFPSGIAIGTELYKNAEGTEQCVFKDKNGFCTLQNAAVKKGMHKWAIKPKYCIMYPLTVIDGTLTYDDDHSRKLDYCGIHKKENFTQSVFEAMQEELIFVLGKEGYDFLKKYYIENFKTV